ncbi:ankyrin repeat-containing domain protein [Xylaria digitata]|nr:ankyrin repeat-containing domain protein [Xylaria digitata]
MIIMLLKAGANVAERDALLATLLRNQGLGKEVLRCILLEAAEVDPDRSEETLLDAVFLSGDSSEVLEVWKRLPMYYTPGGLCAATFRVAIGEMDPEIIPMLLGYRDPKSLSLRFRLLETTAIGIAAYYEHSEILQQLLDHIPMSNDAYMPHFSRSTSLRKVMKAFESDRMRPFWRNSGLIGSVLAFTVESNANILDQLRNRGYELDLMVVSIIAQLDDVSLLMKMVNNQQVLPNGQFTPGFVLCEAIHRGSVDMIKALLKICKGYRDDPFSPWALFDTAIEMGNLAIFDMLLEAGFDPDAPAGWVTMTALQAAATYNRVGLAKRLIEVGVNVNARGSMGFERTALEAAAENGHIDLIQLLLNSGIDTTTDTGQRQYLNAIVYAVSNGHHVAADMLKRFRELTEQEESILEDMYLRRADPDPPLLSPKLSSRFGSSSSGIDSSSRSRISGEDGIAGSNDEQDDDDPRGGPAITENGLTAMEIDRDDLMVSQSFESQYLHFSGDDMVMVDFFQFATDIQSRHGQGEWIPNGMISSEDIFNSDDAPPVPALFNDLDMGGYVEEEFEET